MKTLAAVVFFAVSAWLGFEVVRHQVVLGKYDASVAQLEHSRAVKQAAQAKHQALALVSPNLASSATATAIPARPLR